MVFTGDEFADGGKTIADALEMNSIKASFFLTGNFYKNPAFKSLIARLKANGHYLAAHSDRHLLYTDWTKRDSLLVSEKEFKKDLRQNYKRMKSFKIRKTDAVYFLPPFEWYNKTISDWTISLGLQLVNFSPGTRSAADYTYPGLPGYKSSEEIYQSILKYEQEDPNGLNGFILLTHIGTDERRTDKFYVRLNALIEELKSLGYAFVRIDELLN
ncbi:polysaccharide deacetylase family protein [Chryseolinea sp. H1M3-3]|uniref:polysaccharide deacetylase family protein n=1 Tax=Chryseolinea sp. H1M3-3 TaxID=3034144 RepID=UPI0023EBB7D6|nr:polysaccharide deacetylase family protein [Chryseolinea sp. H1M3-3]